MTTRVRCASALRFAATRRAGAARGLRFTICDSRFAGGQRPARAEGGTELNCWNYSTGTFTLFFRFSFDALRRRTTIKADGVNNRAEVDELRYAVGSGHKRVDGLPDDRRCQIGGSPHAA